jgi:ABC-2 type transport system permease protein
MHKLWLVAKGEYIKRVSKRSFLVGTFLVPIAFGIILGVTILIIDRDKNSKPFGYVDESGVLSSGLISSLEPESITIIEFPEFESAMSALESGQIQAFHVVPVDFLDNLKVNLYYWDEYPDGSVLRDFDDFVRLSLLPGGPDDIQNRIIEGTRLTIQSGDGKRKFDEEFGFIGVIFPMLMGMFLIFSVMGASGYFLQAITDEKENRTMEIMITSLSPWQLIAGKSIGLLGVAFTQIVIWLSSASIAWLVAQQIYPEVRDVNLPWDILLVFFIFFIPSFALIGGMMAAIGGAVTDLQEGQQIAGILNLLFTFPLFLTALVFANPNNPLLVFLSFWPTTSFLTITLRWGFAIIPIWQIIVSWIILVATGILTIWFASRVFRVGMLRYGQRLSLKSVFKAVNSQNN